MSRDTTCAPHNLYISGRGMGVTSAAAAQRAARDTRAKRPFGAARLPSRVGAPAISRKRAVDKRALRGSQKPRALVPLRRSTARAYRGAGRLAAGDHDQRSRKRCHVFHPFRLTSPLATALESGRRQSNAKDGACEIEIVPGAIWQAPSHGGCPKAFQTAS
jgi:hypothetical protein